MSTRKVSIVWKHFEKLDDKRVKCGLCGNNLSYAGSTTAMLSHLHRIHPSAARRYPAAFRSPKYGSVSSASSEENRRKVSPLCDKQRSCSGERAETITQLLTEMVVKDLLPSTVVEGRGFRNLLTYIEPQYSTPSYQSIMLRSQEMYREVRSSVLQDLNQATYVALAMDSWSTYMTITGHWIDNDWHRRSAVLETIEPDATNGSQNLTMYLDLIKLDWGLANKLVACVRDNVNSQVTPGVLSDECSHIACSAHILQLAVNEGLKHPTVQNIIENVKKLVIHFNRSPVILNNFEKTQESLCLPKHRLIQCVCMKWSSVFEMLERVEEQCLAICSVFCDKKMQSFIDESLAISSQQWEFISALLPVLKCLQIATTAMSYESNISLSSILPIISGLLSKHLIVRSEDVDGIKEFKTIISEQLKQRFFGNTGLTDFRIRASVLDPRHKGLKFLDEVTRKNVYDSIRYLLKSYENTSGVTASQEKMEDSTMSFLLHDDYFSELCENEDEFDFFLRAPTPGPNNDPLIWWKENACRYPVLRDLARKYLSCPATSLPSESVASSLDADKKRNCLLPQEVNTLIFLNKNMASASN